MNLRFQDFIPRVSRAAVGETAAPAQAPVESGDPSPGSLPADGGSSDTNRPDFIPEKFWDKDAGQVRLEGLAKAHKELESKIGLTEQAIREKMEPELREKLDAERLTKRPPDPDGYQVKIPEGVAPDGVNFEIDTEDPLFQFWKKFSFEQGFDNEQFNQGIGAYIQSLAGSYPDPAKEIEALGENGQARIQALDNWAKNNISPDSWEELKNFTTTAAGFKALEEMVKKAAGPVLSGEPAPAEAAKTLVELREMMNDPRYYDPARRDDAYISMVQKEFARSFPGRRPA